MPTDLFSTEEANSILRNAFRGQDVNQLGRDVEIFTFTPDWTVANVQLPESDYNRRIRQAIDPFCAEAASRGYGTRVIEPAFEALKNGFEHGNGRNPNKPLRFGWKFLDDHCVAAAADAGSSIDGDFVPFVLRHRQEKHANQPRDFYTWAQTNGTPKERHGTNLGLGTYFLHLYSDEVKYFRSDLGGIVTHFRNNLTIDS